MKEKFVFIPLGEHSHFIKKVKKHWWSRWKTEMGGYTPRIYFHEQVIAELTDKLSEK